MSGEMSQTYKLLSIEKWFWISYPGNFLVENESPMPEFSIFIKAFGESNSRQGSYIKDACITFGGVRYERG